MRIRFDDGVFSFGDPSEITEITVSDDFERLARSAKVNRSLTPESHYFGGF